MTEVQRFRSMVADVLRAFVGHAEQPDDERALADAIDVIVEGRESMSYVTRPTAIAVAEVAKRRQDMDVSAALTDVDRAAQSGQLDAEGRRRAGGR